MPPKKIPISPRQDIDPRAAEKLKTMLANAENSMTLCLPVVDEILANVDHAIHLKDLEKLIKPSTISYTG